MVLTLHRDRLSFWGFEGHKVISGGNSQNLTDNLIHAGQVIIQAAHKKVHIYSGTILKIS